MIISDKEAVRRLTGSNNLINRISSTASVVSVVSVVARNNNNGNNSRSTAMGLFGLNKSSISIPTPQIVEVKHDKVEETKIEETKIEETKIEEPITYSFNPFPLSTPISIPSTIATVDSNKQIEETNKQTEGISVANLLDNSDTQIKLGLAHDNALKLLNESVETLTLKLPNVRADKLPAVITAASKVVESIRKERNEVNKNSKDRDVHFHFYTPTQKKISDYDVIEVEAQVSNQ